MKGKFKTNDTEDEFHKKLKDLLQPHLRGAKFEMCKCASLEVIDLTQPMKDYIEKEITLSPDIQSYIEKSKIPVIPSLREDNCSSALKTFLENLSIPPYSRKSQHSLNKVLIPLPYDVNCSNRVREYLHRSKLYIRPHKVGRLYAMFMISVTL